MLDSEPVLTARDPAPVPAFRLSLLCFLLCALGAPGAVRAQTDGPVRGMIWRMPDDRATAREDLSRMREMGVEAVRTGLVDDTTLLRHADTLGLQLYQELPFARLPARYLADSLEAARDLLGAALRRARGHPSARTFGLARDSDTSEPLACDYVEALAEMVRGEGPGGSRVYYVTDFTDRDACHEAVDFVLVSAQGRASVAAKLARWYAAHPEVPAGVAALGAPVQPGAAGGYRQQGSPAAQARYLEDQLGALLADTSAAAPRAVFVDRWRDQPATRADLIGGATRAGLHTAEGAARPARDVVEGFYTGRQTVFAFAPGEAPSATSPFVVLAGWGVLLLLAVLYGFSMGFRQLASRYFWAHGFYRESIREGREVPFASALVLLLGVALSIGVLAWVVLRALRTTALFGLFAARLPDGLQENLLLLLDQPLVLIGLVACAAALTSLVWSLVLSLFTRRRYTLLPPQTLMLVVWPGWLLIGLLVVAMAVSTRPPETAVTVALVLFGLWMLAALWAHLRTLYDLRGVARLPVYWVVAAGLAHPVFLGLVMLFFLGLEYRFDVGFWWHLATRT